jgi:hypothetical protein
MRRTESKPEVMKTARKQEDQGLRAGCIKKQLQLT